MGIRGRNSFRVQVSFNLENSSLMTGLRDANRAFDNSRKKMEDSYGRLALGIERINRQLMIGIGALAVGIASIGTMAVKSSAEFESLRVAIETLVGSAEKADKLIRDIKQFAAETPLQVEDIQAAAKMLLGFGESVDVVIPKLRLLGEAAAVMNIPLEQMIRVREFLSAGQFRSVMLAPLGISREELARFGARFGEGTTGELLSSGEEAVAAFEALLEDRFGGLFARTFNTMRGRISNLKDQVMLVFAEIGDAMRPMFMRISNVLEATFNKLRKFLETNRDEITQAWQAIGENTGRYLEPLITMIESYIRALERDPDLIVRTAENFNKLVNSMVGLLVINTIVLGFIKFQMLIATVAPVVTAFVSELVIGLALLGESATGAAAGLNITGAAIAGFSKLLPWLGLLIVAIANWREVLTTVGSAIRLVVDFVLMLLEAVWAVIEVIVQFFGIAKQLPPLLQMVGILLDFVGKGFILVFAAVELIIRGLDVLIAKTRDWLGTTGEADAAVARFDEALLKYAERLGYVEDGTIDLIGSTESMQTAIDGIDTSSAVSQLNNFSEALWKNYSIQTLMQLSTLAQAHLPGIGPPSPEAQALLAEGFTPEEVAAALARSFEGERSNLLKEMLEGFGFIAPSGGGGGGGGGGGAASQGFGRGDRYSEAEYLAFLERKREVEIDLFKIEEELLETRKQEEIVTRALRDAEAEKLLRMEAVLRADKVRAAFERKVEARRLAEENAKKQVLLDIASKQTELAAAAKEPINEIWRNFREQLVEGARILGESFISGDVAQALQSVFNMLASVIADYIESTIVKKGADLLTQLLGAAAGGVIGAAIVIGGALLTGAGRKTRGAIPTLPLYAHIVNFPKGFAPPLPFTFMASGRSGGFNVGAEGYSLDRTRRGRRLGFHFQQ